MTPYLLAFQAYHRDGDPHIPWTTALDFHLQHGTVISTPSAFIMFRAVDWDSPDAEHLSLIAFPDSDDVHIWAAAGYLPTLQSLHGFYRYASFQRRNNRLHRVELRHLFKRLRGR